jgi:hypothetical protein
MANWHHTENYLVSCSRDKTCWVWEFEKDSNEFSCMTILSGHT